MSVKPWDLLKRENYTDAEERHLQPLQVAWVVETVTGRTAVTPVHPLYRTGWKELQRTSQVLVGTLLLAPAPVQIKTGKNVTVVAARLATLKAANPLASRAQTSTGPVARASEAK